MAGAAAANSTPSTRSSTPPAPAALRLWNASSFRAPLSQPRIRWVSSPSFARPSGSCGGRRSAPARHRDIERALRENDQACVEATEELRALDRQIREIDRKRAIATLLDARAELLAELASVGETPDLPEDATARRLDAQGRISAGTLALERATRALASLDDEIELNVVDVPLLARGDEVRSVKANAAAVDKAAGDRRKREGELQEAKAESLRRPVTARRARSMPVSAKATNPPRPCPQLRSNADRRRVIVTTLAPRSTWRRRSSTSRSWRRS